MNREDRKRLDDLGDRIDAIDSHGHNTNHKLARILSILEDDNTTSRMGLVSEVDQLNKDVEKLMYVNANIKRVSIFFLSVLSALSIFAAKIFFFGRD